jgi:hypothetical protein
MDINKEAPAMNGSGGMPSEDEKAAVLDIKSIQAREAAPRRTMAEIAVPFAQRDHGLLLESVDRVTDDWVQQLKRVRHNSEQLEQMVLQRAAKLKGDLTQLFLLGGAVASEANRGDELNAKLADEIAKLTEEHSV